MLRAPRSPERQLTPSCFIQTSKYFFFFSVFSESFLTSGQRYQGNIFLLFHTMHQLPDGQSLLYSTKQNDRGIGMATLAKRKQTKALIMVFSSISKQSEHLR
jgi:hypothetical protein